MPSPSIYMTNCSTANSPLVFNNGTCKEDFLFPCKLSETCILKTYKCDGHIQCPGGEDEAFEICNSTFPKEATVKCKAISDESAMPIEIMAFRNDGVKGGLIPEVILVFVLFSIIHLFQYCFHSRNTNLIFSKKMWFRV